MEGLKSRRNMASQVRGVCSSIDPAENHMPKEAAMAGVTISPATSTEVGPWVATAFSIPASSATFVTKEMRVGSAVSRFLIASGDRFRGSAGAAGSLRQGRTLHYVA